LGGKNWGRIITELQNNQHRLMQFDANTQEDRTKLRNHYNNLKKKYANKEFKRKTEKKNTTKEERELFNKKESEREIVFTEMRNMILGIENNELLTSTSNEKENENKLEESKEESKKK